MAEPTPLDSDWLRAHPLPEPAVDADKNERGRVLAVGGCRSVPGGIRLTAEAALRAGAGKVRVATIDSAAIALGVAMPEIAVFGLGEDDEGEIGPGCEAVIAPLLDTVSLHYGGRRVMIVAHQVVVLCLRYVIENLSEAEILAIDKAGDIANCAITEYRFDATSGKDGGLVLARYNVTAPMKEEATPVTAAPDKMVAARG